MKENRISVKEAAELMGASEQFVRIGLQRKELDFGYAVQTSENRWTYFISVPKFEEKTGIIVSENV